MKEKPSLLVSVGCCGPKLTRDGADALKADTKTTPAELKSSVYLLYMTADMQRQNCDSVKPQTREIGRG